MFDIRDMAAAHKVANVIDEFAEYMERQANAAGSTKMDKIAGVCGAAALRGMAKAFRSAGTLDIKPDEIVPAQEMPS